MAPVQTPTTPATPAFHFGVLSQRWGSPGRSVQTHLSPSACGRQTGDEDRVKKSQDRRDQAACARGSPLGRRTEETPGRPPRRPHREEQLPCLPHCTDRPGGGGDGVSGFPGVGEVGGWREGRWTEVIAGCPPQGAGLQLLT